MVVMIVIVATAGASFLVLMVVMTAFAMLVMLMVVMTAFAMLIVFVMVMTAFAMLIVLVMVMTAFAMLIVLVVVMTATALFVVLVVVMTAFAMLVVLVVVMTASTFLAVLVMVMTATAFLIVMVMLMMLMLVLEMLHILCKCILLFHSGEDSLAVKLIPRSSDYNSALVIFSDNVKRFLKLCFLRCLCMRENDAGCVLDLIAEELAKVLHIHLALICVNNCGEAVKLCLLAANGGGRLDNVGELTYARGLDNNPIGVIFLKHLAQRL